MWKKTLKRNIRIAVRPECLNKEKENYEKGIPSKYITVSLFLEKNLLYRI